ncbi:MAG: transporter [Armatimonadetes bacterium]|nr:transporter [Armatimonadota bacterium]
MALALALLAIFAVVAVLMYLNRLPAIVALPIMAIAIALVARVPWRDLAAIISDGAFLLHKAYATAILGAVLAEIVSKTGVAETMVKKTAELGGDRPIILALLMTTVVAVLFVTLGGLGAVIMVATIVFPVLLALGLPRIAVGCLFLLGMSLGGIFNLTNWQLYIETLGLSQSTIISFAGPMVVLLGLVTVAFAIYHLRPSRMSRYWADPEPERRVQFAPWYSLLTPVVPIVPVLVCAFYSLVGHPDAPVYIPVLTDAIIRLTTVLFGRPPDPFDFPIVTAMVIGIAYGLGTCPRPAQGRIQLLTRSAIDGIGAVAPAVALMLGIGMLVQAVRHELVLNQIQPLVTALLPSTRLGYVLIFTVFAPLALYRGPLNIWGMGFGLAVVMAQAPGLNAAAVMAVLLSVGQIQGVCDPTNTHNVWIANYVGVDVQQILRATLPFVWIAASLGLIVGAFLFMPS